MPESIDSSASPTTHPTRPPEWKHPGGVLVSPEPAIAARRPVAERPATAARPQSQAHDPLASPAEPPVASVTINRLVGRMAAILFILGGAIAILGQLAMFPTQPPWPILVVSLVAMLTGVGVWCLPWQRWSHKTSLWLVPLAFLYIAVGNSVWSNPFAYSIYFIGVFTWVGVGHRRGTTLLVLPLYLVAYLVPLILTDQLSPIAYSAALTNGVVCLLVGETLAWLSQTLNQAERELQQRRSETRFEALVQHASDVIAVVEPDATIRYLAPSTERILGYHADELIGLRLGDVVHPAEEGDLQRFINNLATHDDAAIRAEWQVRHTDGSWRRVEAIGTNLLTQPAIEGIVLTLRDITERRTLEAQLTHQAFHDPLTGLANRILFQERLRHALNRSDRHHSALAVLFLDVDNFKRINDSLGHAAGDQTLLIVSQRLLASVRSVDTVARFGGDEFAVLLEDRAGVDDVVRVAERIIETLREPFAVEETEIFTGTSLGIVLGGPGANVDTLLRNADIAMYMAKRTGKGRYAFFEENMHTEAAERLALEADLRNALERQELSLVYQPQVDLRNGHVTGVEALVRWENPRRGVVASDLFLPVAEETGLIVPIGRWVLHHACQHARRWVDRYPNLQPMTVSVNLSPRQFLQDTLIRDVVETLRETGLDPRLLVFEITERTLAQQMESTLNTMQALKVLGVQLAIDDFGTGFSSLNYLQRFPIDQLKIDKVFIDGLGRGANESMASAILHLARTLKLLTIAEGVERADQVSTLHRLGCEIGQGYYFAKPIDQQRLMALFNQLPMTPTWLADSAAEPDDLASVPAAGRVLTA